jgi:uncharacterized protein YkwD
MRSTITAAVCILTLAAGALTACAASPPEPPPAESSPADELVRLVNDYRAGQGMPPLEPDPALMAAAQYHADWMAATHNFTHEGEGGSMPQDRVEAAGYRGWVGENLAAGTIGSVPPEWVVGDGWHNSPGHRQIMLSQHVQVGAGYAQDNDMDYYVLVVGTPSGDAAPTLAPTPTPPPDALDAPDPDLRVVIVAAAAILLILLGVLSSILRRVRQR